MNPNSSEHFLYFRAIQGHSGGTLVDPTLQNNVLLPDDFAENIYHVGERSRHALHHPVWIDSGRWKPQERQAFSILYSRESDEHISAPKRRSSMTWINPELQCTRIPGEFTSKFSIFVLFESYLEGKDCSSIKHDLTQWLFSQHFTCDMCWESGIHEDWRRLAQQSTLKLRGYREQPYSHRICIMDIRIFLSAKREHPPTIKANESRGTRRLVRSKFEETRSGSIDFRIQRLPHSTVQKERLWSQQWWRNWSTNLIHTRTVTRWWSIWTRLRKFNQFSEKSKELISSMGNTEYFCAVRDLF